MRIPASPTAPRAPRAPSPTRRAGALGALALLCVASPAAAHDGDAKLRDRRPRYEVARGTAGSASSNLPLASESMQFPAQGIALLAWIPVRDFGPFNETGNSCSGYVSPGGREYAIVGLSRGTAFVEVTDPGDPRIVGFIDGPESLWRDMKVHQGFCYAVSEGGFGIQVIDLAQIDAGVVTLATEVTTGGATGTHTVALDSTSGFLYRCGGAGNGLRIYSLASPANPVYVGAWSDRYVHEAQVVTYTSGPYAGKQIAFACTGLNNGWVDPSLDILDVTNKSSIVLLKRFRYSNPAYSHQGWLSEDRQWFYLNDELDENGTNLTRTRVINVASLTNPVEHPSVSAGSTSIDHNLYVHQGRMYQSNYTSGLSVFDLSNPAAPVRTAWFDTWPENDAAQFNSLWNNYPFLPSGTILGSDIEKGLFVWRLGAPDLDFAFPVAFPARVDPRGEAVAVEIQEAQAGLLVAGSARLHVLQGSTWNEYPLAHQGGAAHLASFPPSSCGADVAWYLTARTTNGITWSYPQGAPTIVAHATAAASETAFLVDRLESAGAWTGTAPGDTATSGRWVHGDPFGTPAQPEDDHTLAGTKCWFTGQAMQLENMGAADVDNGITTLTTPDYDLSALQRPVISYWRWYSNDLGGAPNTDVFVIEISNDGGASWHLVEQVGPAGPGTSGGWILHQFAVADVVAPTSTVRLRFVASDLGSPSNVEAAIDDFSIYDIGCPPVGPEGYCVAKINSQGCAAATASSGVPSTTSAAPFLVTCSNVLSQKPGILIWGLGRASTPFQGGTLCLAAPVRRTPVQNSGGSTGPVDCSGSFAFDFNAYVQGGAHSALVPGQRVDCQYWYRDPLDPAGFGSGLSDAIEFILQP